MSIEQQFYFAHIHTRAVTALGYNPARREILAGCEGIVFYSKRQKKEE